MIDPASLRLQQRMSGAVPCLQGDGLARTGSREKSETPGEMQRLQPTHVGASRCDRFLGLPPHRTMSWVAYITEMCFLMVGWGWKYKTEASTG